MKYVSDYNAWNRGLNAACCFNKIFAFLGKLESQGIVMKVSGPILNNFSKQYLYSKLRIPPVFIQNSGPKDLSLKL